VRPHRRLRLALAWIAGALAVWLLLLVALMAATLEPSARAQFFQGLAPRAPLLALAWALAVVAAWIALRRWWLPRAAALPALAEQTQAIVKADEPLLLPPRPRTDERPLVDAINALAAQRDGLRADAAADMARASANVRQERNRLAALMSELTQSVVVCHRDGRILLYNQRARMQFRALSDAPQLAGGAELVGIGRSIYAVFDQQMVAHALDRIGQRLARGAAHPSAQFVTPTRRGQLLRVLVAPVAGAGESGGTALDGFVLMLDNITRSYEEGSARTRLLHELIEGFRASLAQLQPSIERLGDADLDPTVRERHLTVVRSEMAQLRKHVEAAAHPSSGSLRTRWPLEDMLGAEFVELAARQMTAQCGVPVTLGAVDGALGLRLDSFSFLQALMHLGQRLVEAFGVRGLTLRLARHDQRARLDLVWTGHAMSTETAMGWELDPMRIGGEPQALSVRDVIQRHDAEMRFERDRATHQACFSFLLPLAGGIEAAPERHAPFESRPEFFDFDLFDNTEPAGALNDRRLSELVYTVFDTETTGLNPSGGDEIIQLGAARVVNGRLLRQESFEQLIDPGRAIPAAGIRIHGIRPEMVAGQPRIDAVLPAFHLFAQDTVLVAHNAAFDMKFLQAPARRVGLRFQQPVLDTLLLSALVHPHQESHRLEAIAARFGIAVLGRHTALGDALVTAEVLLKLIPLLGEMGIVTLAQALHASRQTQYARLKY
jgi:DNA polymerase-3 subunit epsilon